MAGSDDPWHYPRPDLARSYLGLLENGLTNALVLFGRRRIGKTEFLLQDLAPLAEQGGRLVVYTSFWMSPLSPAAALLHTLETALKGGALAQRLQHAARRLSPKIKLSAGAFGARGEAEIDLSRLQGAPPADVLLHIDSLIGQLAKRSGHLLLLLDEVQELAAEPHNAALVSGLRTSLDTRKNAVSAVFTGSNRDRLNAMFTRRAAPFFQFATPIDLPPLDAPFVDHLLGAFTAATGARLDRARMLRAFADAHGSPFMFRKLLELLAIDPKRDVDAAAEKLRARLAGDLGYDRIWFSLSPIQRGLARMIALKEPAIFSDDARRRLGETIDDKTPSAAQVQAALRRLLRLGLVLRLDGRSEYALDDPEFGAWLTRDESAS